jgi:hypothetical protein
VIQHVSNKRKRTGLDTIPDDIKRKVFDTIPSHVKVDLFNSLVKTAFPNFDNLMIAAWNVVTIYTACGSDFPELHRAIVDLKGVLQDFDETFGQRVDRATPKYRHDFGGPSRDGANRGSNQNRNGTHDQDRGQDDKFDDAGHHGSLFGAPVPTLEQNGANDADQFGDTSTDEPTQLQDSIVEHTDDTRKSKMPLSRLLKPSQSHEDSNGDDDGDQIPAVDPHLAHTLEEHSTVHQARSRHTAEIHIGGSVPTSANSSPGQQHVQPPREHVKKVREQEVDDADTEGRALITLQTTPQLHDHPTLTSTSISMPKPRNKRQRHSSEYSVAQLEKKYKERKAHILGTFENNMNKVPEKHRRALQSMEALIEERKKDEAEKKADKNNGAPKESGSPGISNSGMFGNYPGNPPSNYLGNSVLGAKKPTSVAPVAPMFPNGSRKDPRNGVAGGRRGSTPPYGRRH